jgi:hypothetical protein
MKQDTYHIVNIYDANDYFIVLAANENDATHEGLSQLGWFVSKQKVDEDDDQFKFNF